MTTDRSDAAESPAVGRAAITKVLRVHSGEDFAADDFPTLEEGKAAWAEWQRLQRNRPTPAEVEAAWGPLRDV